MAFFYVYYVFIYQTVTSLTYVFVPLDFRPLIRLRPKPLKTPYSTSVHPTAIRNRTILFVSQTEPMYSLRPGAAFFLCHMKHFSLNSHRCNILSPVWGPLGIRKINHIKTIF
ncbi:hypothetical protein F0A99_15955 [Salmonella enterica]|nr:hypothetical protein [Salmonella enterica]ECQ3939336.1 hypothetical protein [Salmonella enterica]